jgi:hypothetical protein
MLRSKLLPAGCALALILPACVENDTSVFVAGVLAGSPPECEYKPDQGSALFPSGVMDVGFTTTYRAELLVGLQLATRGDKSKLRAESMNFIVRGAEVRLTDARGDLIDEFSVPSGGKVAPSSADTPGFGIAEVVLIPNDVGADLRADVSRGEGRTVVAEVRVFGDTLGGAELTSGSFTYVIDICHGCLLTAVTDGWAYDENTEAYWCDTALNEPLVANGCVVGQDGYYDCRYCSTDECFLRPW